MTAIFLQGHVIDCLRGLPPDYFHCVVTSPPYWALRRYAGEQDVEWPDGSRGAFGLEKTLEAYVEHTVAILREVRRVLRDDGVVWWNIGDSYAANRSYQVADTKWHDVGNDMSSRVPAGLKPLDACLVPFRVALALQQDGWYVRSVVIWDKVNPLPESVNGWRYEKHRIVVKHIKGDVRGLDEAEPLGGISSDNGHDRTEWIDCPGCSKCLPNDGLVLRKSNWRPTDNYEFILMLAKTGSYFCDKEAVKESGVYPGGRNLRAVWTFPTLPFRGAHFATFPPRLAETAIKASTSEKGCCPECGSPWVRVLTTNGVTSRERLRECGASNYAASQLRSGQGLDYAGGHTDNRRDVNTVGWRPSCTCSAGDPIPCRVLDPFSGAGTTALVAERLGQDSIGIDIAAEYIAMAQQRLAADAARESVKNRTNG